MDVVHLKLLSEFLAENTREDLKLVALHEVFGLTGTLDGCSLIESTNIVKLLLGCLLDKNETICKTACLSLVNISASEKGVDHIINTNSCNKQEVIARLIQHILNPDSNTADAACMTLSNLTRLSKIANIVVDYLQNANIEISKLINAFTKTKYNSKGCNLHYLGPLFSNLSQIASFRKQLMSKNKCLVQKLLPFTQFKDSPVRRSGIVGALKNCCFDPDYHEWLLEDMDILPALLLPLAGPEEFDEEDNDKLPLDLQYLGEDKQRESDPDIRKMLLEAIHQLCATKSGREYLRNKNVYVILREYHKWENDRTVLLVCENIVDILIRTEEEINEDNLKELEVPESYVSKFEEMDEHYIKDN